MAEIMDWFNQMPPITRHWFAGSVAIPLLCRFNIIDPMSVVLTTDFLGKLHLWKPLTGALFYHITPQSGFHYLINLYLIYSYSQRLEMGFFSGRPADYMFMLIFNWIAILGLALMVGAYQLMDPLVMCVIYIYCMLNQDQIVTFWFGTRFKARYLPWALFGVNFILGSGTKFQLWGILVGHLYYFVTIKYPAEQGTVLLKTPNFLYRFFPQSPYSAPPTAAAATTTTTTTRSNTAGPNPPAAPTGHNWGRGRRLAD